MPSAAGWIAMSTAEISLPSPRSGVADAIAGCPASCMNAHDSISMPGGHTAASPTPQVAPYCCCRTPGAIDGTPHGPHLPMHQDAASSMARARCCYTASVHPSITGTLFTIVISFVDSRVRECYTSNSLYKVSRVAMAVSSLHEGMIELVRKQPEFVPELLTQFLDIGVPAPAVAQLVDSVFNEATAVEYRADAVVVMKAHDATVLTAVVEAQLQKDEHKRFTWPHYATGARVQHRCPAIVLVVTPDPLVASWAAQPIDLGPGSVFRPQVIHPGRIPKIVNAREAAQDLQLAALSVIAHGKGDVDAAVTIALALSRAIEALPGTEQWLYLSLIENALSHDAKEKLKMMPEAPKYFSETLRRSWEQDVAAGEAKGEAKGKAKALLRILAQRGLPVSDDQQRRIHECTDVAALDRWLDRALLVASVDELLE